AIGSNKLGAAEAGVRVKLVTIRNYMLCALTAGLVGVFEAIRSATVQPNPAGPNEILFLAVAAAATGGTLLTGGSGTGVGALVGESGGAPVAEPAVPLATAPDDVLRVEHIAKRFGPVTALRDVNLHLRKGEVLGLLGDNGAGKSTLIKIICGFQKQDSGRMLLHGKPYEPKSVDDAR